MSADWTSLVAASATAFTTLIFARAALHKLGDFTTFTGFVADYQVVSERQVAPVSMALAAAEVVVVATAFLPGLQPLGSVVAIGLYLLYATAIGLNVARGRDRVECGCGGAVQPLSWTLVARNFVLAAIAAIGLAGPISALSVAEAVTAIVSGFTLFVGYQLVEQIMANFTQMRLKR
ncbi:hypothetical protein ASC89_24330 [Devosia sp. Root413D1]|uniref:MauE/DoxX family redox-associated membrane protein n=1 Tax=Devosia sp. Root413D1 TaxID=1736531 RepID=UPI0006FE452F|nr:MauE/DoxX family redox-associated membrane protein [Devosia sp. Root413D1]KQW76042.1 hypothetical protein ASC89_24330 [Devosia sp. Root413D1]